MNKYYSIDVDEYFSSYKFYNSFLSQLHDYFSSSSHTDKIIINFSNVNKISPLVVPNLLNVGIILRNYFGEPVEVFVPWNRKLIAYLRDIDFFDLNESLNIFQIDKRFTGGVSLDRSISDICGTLLIEKEQGKADIYNCYLNRYKAPLLHKLNSEDTVNNILYIMAELSHNGAQHSEGSCFVSFQLNQMNKFEFSVSDCGIGYKESLFTKERDLIFKNFDHQNEINLDHFISILEAIFYRKETHEEVYGIYSIFNDVLPLGGVIRVHTHNTQAVFTSHNFKEFLEQQPTRATISQIIEKFTKTEKSTKNLKHKPLRVSPVNYKGVHIEIEIPFNN